MITILKVEMLLNCCLTMIMKGYGLIFLFFLNLWWFGYKKGFFVSHNSFQDGLTIIKLTQQVLLYTVIKHNLTLYFQMSHSISLKFEIVDYVKMQVFRRLPNLDLFSKFEALHKSTIESKPTGFLIVFSSFLCINDSLKFHLEKLDQAPVSYPPPLELKVS